MNARESCASNQCVEAEGRVLRMVHISSASAFRRVWEISNQTDLISGDGAGYEPGFRSKSMQSVARKRQYKRREMRDEVQRSAGDERALRRSTTNVFSSLQYTLQHNHQRVCQRYSQRVCIRVTCIVSFEYRAIRRSRPRRRCRRRGARARAARRGRHRCRSRCPAPPRATCSRSRPKCVRRRSACATPPPSSPSRASRARAPLAPCPTA